MRLKNILIQEGGYALRDAGVQRIKREDIDSTIKFVSGISGVPKQEMIPLGSVGKSPTSGDIDLAIDITKHDPDALHTKMVKALGEENCVVNKATKVNSYAVPIKGDEKNGRVQVDFMFGANPEWMQFAYYSEGENSKYKGLVRTILIMSVAAALNKEGFDHFKYSEDGELIIRAGRTLDLTQGLRRIFQHRPKKKSGEGYLSTMKSIPIEDFMKMFPNVKVKGGQVVIDDPQKVVTALFGSGVTPNDVRTAEQVLSLIRRKFNETDQEKIFKYAASRGQSAAEKAKFPPEITQYFQ